MTPELQKYYEDRIAMCGSSAWKELMADVDGMMSATDSLALVNDEKSLFFRKGELSMMRWLQTVEQMARDAYNELTGEK